MKYVDPDQIVTCDLPLHLLISLYHFLNAPDVLLEDFVKQYNTTSTPVFKSGKGEADMRDFYSIEHKIKSLFNVRNVSALRYRKPVSVTVHLTDKHTATWDGSKNVKVGCSSIPVEAIRDLMIAIDNEKTGV
jgi:hypothetical protein